MYGALALAFLGLGAIIYDFASDGLRVVSWQFVTSFPSRVIPEPRGHRVGDRRDDLPDGHLHRRSWCRSAS